jgi:peptidoglycan L-alanyl-D-glutamate endopeptidase CwlK
VSIIFLLAFFKAIFYKVNMSQFSRKSIDILNQCHSDLIKLMRAVGEEYNCSIVCGYRGKEEQEDCFNKGTSKAHFGQSPHNYSPALAVDCVPYPTLWSDENKLKELAGIIKIKAIDLEIEITWGGDFPGFPDLPHYQLKNWLKMI